MGVTPAYSGLSLTPGLTFKALAYVFCATKTFLQTPASVAFSSSCLWASLCAGPCVSNALPLPAPFPLLSLLSTSVPLPKQC